MVCDGVAYCLSILKPKIIAHAETERAVSVSGIATFLPNPTVNCIAQTTIAKAAAKNENKPIFVSAVWRKTVPIANIAGGKSAKKATET